MRKGPWAVLAGLAVALAATAGCSTASSSGGAATSPATSAPASSSIPATQPASSPPASSPAPVTQPSTGATPADVTLCAFPVVSCQGSASKVEPTTILLSGDGSLFVSAVTWTSWGAATAQGSGTLNVDGCAPNCAQGTLSRYAATITVTGLTPYGNGKQAYATMTVTAPAKSYNQTFNRLVP